jgi:hypothetical protein
MLNPSPHDHSAGNRNPVSMACGMWGSGGRRRKWGVDTSFDHADGYAARRNVPHTGIEPRHVETARWIRQGRGDRNSHHIVLSPEVGRPRIYAYTIKWPPCVVNVSKLQQSVLHREKAKRRMPLDQVSGTGPPYHGTCTHLVHVVFFPAAVAASKSTRRQGRR